MKGDGFKIGGTLRTVGVNWVKWGYNLWKKYIFCRCKIKKLQARSWEINLIFVLSCKKVRNVPARLHQMNCRVSFSNFYKTNILTPSYVSVLPHTWENNPVSLIRKYITFSHSCDEHEPISKIEEITYDI